MKKHELLEKAMRDYPAGTIARFKLAPKTDHISDGIFQILDLNGDGNYGVFSGSGLNCFYISYDDDRKFIGEWAVPVLKEEPLRIEKIAVKVSNHREVKVVLDHLKKDFSFKITTFPSWIYLEPDRGFDNHYCYVKPGVAKIIDFDFFCAQKGLTMPKFVMKSEDGVDLYEGDKLFEVNRNLNGSWYITSGESGHGYWTVKKRADKWNLTASEGYESKAFSTKEAAESWIKEQNKPKEIEIMDQFKNRITVSIDSLEVETCGATAYIGGEELKKVVAAYLSLQQQSDKTALK